MQYTQVRSGAGLLLTQRSGVTDASLRLFTGGSAPSEEAVDGAAPTPVTSDPPDGDGPRPAAVERVTDIG